MKIVLNVLTITIVVYSKIENTFCKENGNNPQAVRSSIWKILNRTDSNKPKSLVRGYHSVPYYYSYLPETNAQHHLPNYKIRANQQQILPSHLVSRRSVISRLPTLTKSIRPMPSHNTPQPNDAELRENSEDYLERSFDFNLNKVAHNAAQYLRLSKNVLQEHLKYIVNIVKLIFRHIINQIKLMYQQPIRILFLPLTLPMGLINHTVQAVTLVSVFFKYIFTPIQALFEGPF